jgi:hypothetical protein
MNAMIFHISSSERIPSSYSLALSIRLSGVTWTGYVLCNGSTGLSAFADLILATMIPTARVVQKMKRAGKA